MAKRGNGEASYREKVVNGVKYVEGRIRINGKQYSCYAKTGKACRDKIDKLKYNGVPKKRLDITLKEYIENWLDSEVKLNRSINTFENYNTICKKHIIPDLGHYKIVDLNRLTIQQYIKKKTGHIIKYKNLTKSISPRYIALIKTILGAIFKSAVRDEIIDKNPAYEIVLPKKVVKEDTESFLLQDEVDKILSVDTVNDGLASLCKFILMFGLRRNEGRNIKWEDVDFNNKTIAIHGTKTKKAKRVLPLYDLSIKFLKEWKKNQNEYILLIGDSYHNQGYIFTNEFGEPFHEDSLRRGLTRLLKKSNINKKITVHALRHSMATYLIGIKVPMEIVQQILGHENISTTIDTYSHIYLGLKRTAADLLNMNLNNFKNEGNKEGKK